ncbi:T9SS type A sorting domain-containing protein [Taibaiella lutea]|nr:T9SS type A sorting domain-containing protein [Taibaiella lutea]
MKKKLFLAGLLISLFSINAKASIVYVDSSHVGGVQTGTSWANAFSSFQSGIDAANAGDSVWVAKGTYIPATDNSFILKPGIRIFGGFLNSYNSFAQRNWQTNISLLKGNGTSVVQNNGNNAMLRVYLDGFSITGGASNIINNEGFGAGIYSTAPLQVENCNINRNAVATLPTAYLGSVYGGGIYSAGNLIVKNSIIAADSAKSPSFVNGVKSFGGGIYNADSLQLINSTISGNIVISDSSRGAGIYNASVLSITDCNIINNYGSSTSTFTATYGAGIFNAGTLFLSGGVISNNTASSSSTTTASSSHGGGIFNQGIASIADSCIIKKNTAFNGGGIFSSGSLSIESCKVDSNRAWEYGAGISSKEWLMIVGTSISYNSILGYYSSYGGGIANYDTLYMNGCQVIGNLSSSSNYYGLGGGIFTNKLLTIYNSIISNNKDTSTYGSYGGGISNYGALEIFSTQVSNNVATNHYNSSNGGGIYSKWICITGVVADISNNRSDNGGGMFIDSVQGAPQSMLIDKFTFTGNKARFSGGGMFNKDITSQSKISECIFSADTAKNGGGIYNLKASPDMINMLFSRNIADTFGAAVYNKQSSPKIINNTMALNVATVDGAGMYNVTSSNPVVDNTIIWGNSSGTLNTGGSSMTNKYSLIQGLAANTANHTIDGSVDPLFTDTSAGVNNYQLLPGSPCLNTGNNNALPTGYVFDIGGNARISGASIDMGAYELPITPFVNLGPDTVLCAGTTLILDALNYDCTYLWNTGSTERTLAVTTSGTYFVTATSNLGSSTDTIVVTFNPAPVVNLGNNITVTTSSYTLDAGNPGAAYLWNTGETTQTITVNSSGNYKVRVTNSNGCSASDSINVTFQTTGIGSVSKNANNLIISPNPATDAMTIDISNAMTLLHSSITMTDATGRIVRTFAIENKIQACPLTGIAPGMYFLRTIDGSSFKIIKQ